MVMTVAAGVSEKRVTLENADLTELKVAQVRPGKIRLLFNDGRPEGVFERQVCAAEMVCNDFIAARILNGDLYFTDSLKGAEVVLDREAPSGKTRAVLKFYY